jgi:hypothetical protein
MTNGQGVFILTDQGVAGSLSGTIAVTAEVNLAVGGTISARVKTFAGAAVDETINWADRPCAFSSARPRNHSLQGGRFHHQHRQFRHD